MQTALHTISLAGISGATANTMLAILFLIIWPMFLLVVLVSYRAVLTLSGKKKAHTFLTTGEDIGPFSIRLVRAHANCYEHLPFAIALLLFSLVTGNGDFTGETALWFVAARVSQSVTHLISVTELAVKIRFTFLVVQLGLITYWLIHFLSALV